MLSDQVRNSLNDQLQYELYSAYIYLAMAAHFEAVNLKGFAQWMKVQANEEVSHAMRFYAYLNDRGSRVTLKAIEEPAHEWKSPLAAFENAYEHEQKVTARIDKLVELARSQKDNATEVFLQWFVTEQVEEEANALEIVEKLRMIKEHPQGILMLDGLLGKREG